MHMVLKIIDRLVSRCLAMINLAAYDHRTVLGCAARRGTTGSTTVAARVIYCRQVFECHTIALTHSCVLSLW
jgi:predicted N-acetyltransferase YhbS